MTIPTRLLMFLLAVGTALALAGCGTDSEIDPPGPEAQAEDTGSTQPESNGASEAKDDERAEDDGNVQALTSGLLVATGEDRSELALYDPASGAVVELEAPPELGDVSSGRAWASSSGRYVLIDNWSEVVLWDRADGGTEWSGTDARILAAAPVGVPRVVVIEVEASFFLVDLDRGELHDLTSADLWPAVLVSIDDAGEIALITSPGRSSVVVDLESGAVAEHKADAGPYFGRISPDGTTIVSVARAEERSVVAAIDAFDPATSTVWYESPAGSVVVDGAWIDGQLIVTESTGRIMSVAEGTGTEIAAISTEEPSDLMAPVLHTDPTDSSGFVVFDNLAFESPWHHIDLGSGEVTALSALAGHRDLVSPLPGYVLAGEEDESGARVPAVRMASIADGSVVTLVDDASSFLSVSRGAESTVALAMLGEGGEPEVRVVTTEGESLAVLPGATSVALESTGGRAAYTTRIDDEVVTIIVTLDDSAEDVKIPGVVALDWIPGS